ncbi:unnamed protein product [Prorocentrum cordatum]|uniref:Uncharacterized protein n=1 Tax=Prorocentrum cordatum TaxID=2364126 RepID=A0ABN9T6Y6_9DINO|nr:unnamed protein product [Polarella glacialis]
MRAATPKGRIAVAACCRRFRELGSAWLPASSPQEDVGGQTDPLAESLIVSGGAAGVCPEPFSKLALALQQTNETIATAILGGLSRQEKSRNPELIAESLDEFEGRPKLDGPPTLNEAQSTTGPYIAERLEELTDWTRDRGRVAQPLFADVRVSIVKLLAARKAKQTIELD